MACFKLDGKSPVDRERLTMFAIVGARTGRHFFRRPVGSGSKSHCLSGRHLMMLVISTALVNRKDSNAGGLVAGAGK